jgi:hypothetical protein
MKLESQEVDELGAAGPPTRLCLPLGGAVVARSGRAERRVRTGRMKAARKAGIYA